MTIKQEVVCLVAILMVLALAARFIP